MGEMKNGNYYGVNVKEELKKIYDEKFIEGIACESLSGRCVYTNQWFGGALAELISMVVRAGYEAVLGSGGRLTDRDPEQMGMMKGEHFIVLLECAYAMEKDMLSNLVMCVLPKLEEGGIEPEEEVAFIGKMRKREMERKENYGQFAGMGRMIPEKYLKDAVNGAKQYVQDHNGVLPELEDLYLDEEWKGRYRSSLSYVKEAAWRLIESHLELEAE